MSVDTRKNRSRIFDENKVTNLADNALLKCCPYLFNQWDFTKNDKLKIDIYSVSYGSGKKVWWYCEKCDDSYPQRISVKSKGSGCSICLGKYVTKVNSLATINPKLASEWHPTKNGGLTPHDVTCGSEKKVWWLCKKCNNPYPCTLMNRTSNKNCPYCCINPKVLKGFNDMWTTNPNLASLLLNPEDGYKYTQMSNVKVDWKCPECEETIKERQINSINSTRLACKRCSDGLKYPEKVMFHLLKSIYVDFIHDTPFNWSNKKRYDFYIPSLNMIIETHGEQHINGRFETIGGRNLEEEQENDKYKRSLALENGIDKYVEIDCKESDLFFIKNSILASELSAILDLSEINWIEIGLISSKSMVLEVCSIYENNMLSPMDIANQVGISVYTIYKYLKQGADLGLCVFESNSIKNKSIAIAKLKKKVVQLDKKGVFICEYSSIKNAGIKLNKPYVSNISACCKGKSKTAHGFKWMYKEDYENMLKEKVLI